MRLENAIIQAIHVEDHELEMLVDTTIIMQDLKARDSGTTSQ
jgi:hypothetical protein